MKSFGSSLLVLLVGILMVSGIQAARRSVTPFDPYSEELFQAAVDNDRDAIAAALFAGGDINARDNKTGQTALMAASLRGNARAVEFLLKKGADVTIPEKDGYTPPHGAGFQGRAEILRILHAHGVDVINTRHKDGFLPFHRACWGREDRHFKVVRVMVEEFGIDPKIKAADGQTCFQMSPNSSIKVWLREREIEARHKSEL